MVQAKILFAATEAAPLAKVGGMGDVVGTLPGVLRKMGHDVRVIMPFYGFLWEQPDFADCVARGPVWSAPVMGTVCNVYETVMPDSGVPLFLVEHFAFSPQRVYYGDDEFWRFTFFSRSVAEFAWNFIWKPNIVHCHDWHTALIPAWLRETSDIGTAFTIHNLAYQGPWRWQLERMVDWLPWFFNVDNTMAAGIAYADMVNTVSPTYAREICTPVQGEYLDALLRSRGDRLCGILNGIDLDIFNPATDKHLVANFDVDSIPKRQENKAALQQELGLPVGETILLGLVSRLVEQKGIDLILQVMDRFLAYNDAQFVILGSGESYYEDRLGEMAARWPGKMVYYKGYNASMAQRIYGGSDVFVMPSRFEPCGISQMIALRYGSVPLVRRTGGLVDTVSHHVPALGQGTGYCFDRYEPLDFFTSLVRAAEAYQYKDAWLGLQKRAMQSTFSWQESAIAYLEMYERIMQVSLR
ncbi:MAG: glycogen synthase GlgA [Synechococcaceae cyanobacterium SM2_3_60]|nr:glycogen synthase GlgA [Synechococcaceae cyanobacterium SM2_3_60]